MLYTLTQDEMDNLVPRDQYDEAKKMLDSKCRAHDDLHEAINKLHPTIRKAIWDALPRKEKAPEPEQPTAGPVSLMLSCPKCNEQHIDKGEWETRLHKTHLCESCFHEWRPQEVYTVGV